MKTRLKSLISVSIVLFEMTNQSKQQGYGEKLRSLGIAKVRRKNGSLVISVPPEYAKKYGLEQFDHVLAYDFNGMLLLLPLVSRQVSSMIKEYIKTLR